MDAINQKIDDAQKAHDEHVKMLEEKFEADRKAHEDHTVGTLLGKLI